MDKRGRLSRIAEYGCIICMMPAVVHHLRGHEFGTGTGKKASDDLTIPLCPRHHTGDQGFHIIGQKTWEAKYGTQRELLQKINSWLDQQNKERDYDY